MSLRAYPRIPALRACIRSTKRAIQSASEAPFVAMTCE